jgi:small-conductance mechanosensitive channel
MTTGFLSAGKRVYIPNSVLLTKEILNYRRGGNIGVSTAVKVDISIDHLKLVELEKRMIDFVDSHPRKFVPQGCTFRVDKLELNNTMTYNFWIPLKGSPQNLDKWVGNKNLFMNELKEACVDLDIKTTYYQPISQMVQ